MTVHDKFHERVDQISNAVQAAVTHVRPLDAADSKKINTIWAY